MPHVSPPLRVALIAVLALGVVWLTVLRPTADTAAPAPATAPGVAGLATATDKAKGAAATATAAGARAAGQGSATTTATPARSAPAPARAPGAKAAPALRGVADDDPSGPLVRAVARGKVVVLLFANRRSSDDRAVRGALADVSTRAGRVVKRAADVRHVGRYEAITRGAKVAQSPTALVIGADRAAHVVAGLTTTGELQQLADDAVVAAAKRRR